MVRENLQLVEVRKNKYIKDDSEKEAFECVFIHKNGKAILKSVQTGLHTSNTKIYDVFFANHNW